MTYIYDCDGWCGESVHDERPALTGEFNEEFYKATRQGGEISEAGFDLGDLVTLCGDCTYRLLLEE